MMLDTALFKGRKLELTPLFEADLNVLIEKSKIIHLFELYV